MISFRGLCYWFGFGLVGCYGVAFGFPGCFRFLLGYSLCGFVLDDSGFLVSLHNIGLCVCGLVWMVWCAVGSVLGGCFGVGIGLVV